MDNSSTIDKHQTTIALNFEFFRLIAYFIHLSDFVNVVIIEDERGIVNNVFNGINRTCKEVVETDYRMTLRNKLTRQFTTRHASNTTYYI